MPLEGEMASSWWGFVCLCLASQMPSKQDFFVPKTNLGVKLFNSFTNRGAHMRNLI